MNQLSSALKGNITVCLYNQIKLYYRAQKKTTKVDQSALQNVHLLCAGDA